MIMGSSVDDKGPFWDDCVAPPAAKYESLAKENTRTLLFQGWIDDKSQHIRKEEVKSVLLSERHCPTDVRWHLLKTSQGNVAIGLHQKFWDPNLE